MQPFVIDDLNLGQPLFDQSKHFHFVTVAHRDHGGRFVLFEDLQAGGWMTSEIEKRLSPQTQGALRLLSIVPGTFDPAAERFDLLFEALIFEVVFVARVESADAVEMKGFDFLVGKIVGDEIPEALEID